jgi:tetratricopeptide (TPR) repeat protein
MMPIQTRYLLREAMNKAIIEKGSWYLPLIVSVVILHSACETVEFGFKVINISGMVYDFSNRPVSNYEIVLDRWYSGSTDINGRFTLLKIPLGNHEIRGSKKGYEDYTGEVIIKNKGQIIYIRVPSQNQLLSMADEALTANNFMLAEEIVERAYQIDKNNIEMLFYYAAILFRQNNLEGAASLLEDAVNLGSKDLYVQKFLSVIRRIQDENKTR